MTTAIVICVSESHRCCKILWCARCSFATLNGKCNYPIYIWELFGHFFYEYCLEIASCGGISLPSDKQSDNIISRHITSGTYDLRWYCSSEHLLSNYCKSADNLLIIIIIINFIILKFVKHCSHPWDCAVLLTHMNVNSKNSLSWWVYLFWVFLLITLNKSVGHSLSFLRATQVIYVNR